MKITTDGLIISEMNIGEQDRLVTALTRSNGIVRAFVKGAKNIRNTKSAATRLLCYSRLDIFIGRDKYIIDDAQINEVFFALREDIGRLSLAQYFCELAGYLAPENENAEEYLRLALNCLYFLANEKRTHNALKAIFELRILSISGYMPDLVCCAECKCYEAEKMYFRPASGTLLCGECNGKNGNEAAIEIGMGVTAAMRHIVYSKLDKVFSFTLDECGEALLAHVSELYTLSRIDRDFTALKFYKTISR